MDEVRRETASLLPKLNISNDDFIRTTRPGGTSGSSSRSCSSSSTRARSPRPAYKGFYSTRQEQFLQDKDRTPDGTWPEIFGEVTEIVEANYFFKLQQYQAWLVEFLTQNHRDFIFPAYRQKQVIEFLKEPGSTTSPHPRPRERLEWGIPTCRSTANYVTYVRGSTRSSTTGPPSSTRPGDLARGASCHRQGHPRSAACRLLADHAQGRRHPAAQGHHCPWLVAVEGAGRRCPRVPATRSTRLTSSPSSVPTPSATSSSVR